MDLRAYNRSEIFRTNRSATNHCPRTAASTILIGRADGIRNIEAYQP
jgi:hypothetical protein